ncbi:hypothetical protein MLD38_036223 [Melastoma candidum]|uniref:Uncharacterized protein n=1 Tax=Melastoma candidum TaxID=119954 RepID=A0ACB9LJG3_9MYRT|nr:hypothetical protein MLD38_036223 [Melastoma candidum]
MVRAPCCEKTGLKRGPWTPDEDKILVAHIEKHGHGNWRALPKLAGLLRCGKSCRLRWINYLRPDIRRGNFTWEEEETIIKLHEMLGNRWSAIAARLPGRTDNEIKNVWHTHLKKRQKDKPVPNPEPSNDTSEPETVADVPTSPLASSEVTSASDLSNVMVDSGIRAEIKCGEKDPFRVLDDDESFWSGDLGAFSMMEDGISSNSSSSYSSWDFIDLMDVPGQNGANSEDNGGFWYDLLLKTGGVPGFGL